MQLYSNTITMPQLEAIASKYGMELYNVTDFYGARSRRSNFVLRPLKDCEFRKRGHNGRRVWAINWDGHYEFMADVFDLDENAKIKTAVKKYSGKDDFLETADYPPLSPYTGKPIFS